MSHRVGCLESDSANVLRQQIGVAPDLFNRSRSVGLIDPHGAARAPSMRMQKQHNLADGELLLPGAHDFQLSLWADGFGLLPRIGSLLDHFEEFLAEARNEPFGIDRADALDHPAGQILLHALARVRRRRFEMNRFELAAMLL